MKKVKIKKEYLIAGVIALLLIIGWIFVRFAVRGGEDSWVKDSRGVYVKHGNPAETPDYVAEQQEAITCALNKFNAFSGEINSQCLGVCEDYAVDIVHVPRTAEDDLTENQCEEYGNGQVNHFIELDRNEEIVRIV